MFLLSCPLSLDSFQVAKCQLLSNSPRPNDGSKLLVFLQDSPSLRQQYQETCPFFKFCALQASPGTVTRHFQKIE